MEPITLGLFLLAAFLGGFASGLAGFAMGFVVAGIWLHVITPIQTTVLIVGYGLVTQGYGVWKLRRSLDWRRLAPFIIGGTVGVPLGTMLLTGLDARYLRLGVGVLLVLYGLYGLTQPALKPLQVGRTATYDRVNRALFAGYLVNLAKKDERGLKIAIGSPLPDAAGFLPTVDEVVVEDHPDADTPVREVGQRPPSLVDVERAVALRDAAT